MQKHQEWLRIAWLGLWFNISPVRGEPLGAFEQLVDLYAESHRRYHTLGHIAHCLEEFSHVRHLAKDPNAVAFALWYHDTIYDPHAKDNEERSAELARAVVSQALLSDLFGQRVAGLILATKHTNTQTDPDVQLVVDIDLSSLGSPEEQFDENTRGIRFEYGWLTDEEFLKGRMGILKLFLERPVIFSTEYFRAKYEAQARKNITLSLEKLSGKP